MLLQEFSALDETVKDIQASLEQIEKKEVEEDGEGKTHGSDSESESEDEEGELRSCVMSHLSLSPSQHPLSVPELCMTTQLAVTRSCHLREGTL